MLYKNITGKAVKDKLSTCEKREREREKKRVKVSDKQES